MPVRIFLHGLESSNQGTKSVFFKQKYPDMIIPNFKGNLPERMNKLNRILSQQRGIRIVGSSFGGLMATLFAMENPDRVTRLVLLAPAINLMESAPYKKTTVSVPVALYHGRDDEVIPLDEVKAVAKETFTNLSLHVMEDDHFLHKTFKHIDWDSLLALRSSSNTVS